jgi:CHAT domain-containing protein/tetratricopeptide (TPR) repeat protein
VLVLTAALCAQPGAESNPFYKDLTQPWALYHAGKLDEAAAGFRAVLEKATAAQNDLAQAWAHDALGMIFNEKADYPAAKAAYERALGYYQSAHEAAGEAIANQQLGNVHESLGNEPAARTYFRRALQLFEGLGMLRFQAAVMTSLSHTKDPEAEALEKRALEIARQLKDVLLQAKILHQMGDGFFMRGIFDEAEGYYSQAAALYEALGPGGRSGLAGVLTSQGRVQRAHGHSEKALELYTRALKLQQEDHDRPGAIQSTNAIAVAWEQLGDHTKAISYYQQALGMARETGSPRMITFATANLAGAYIGLGKDQQAAEILEKLLREYPEMEWAEQRHQGLAVAYYNLGRFPESIAEATKSMEIMQRTQRFGALPDAFFWRARAEEKTGNHEAALADSQASLSAIEELRKHLVPNDFMKRGFAEATQRTFGLSIQLLTAAHQPERSLEVAEAARSRAFLDLLATRSFQTAPVELQAESEDTADQPAGEADASAIWRQWTSMDTELRSASSAQPVSFSGVQATARRLDSTVLSYWVSADTTYVWVVAPSGEVHSTATTVSADRIRKLISGLWPVGDAALAPDPANRNNWNELYRLLVQPVEKWLPQRPGALLTIEPHGPLLRLPFAALRDGQGRYLVERFTLHYVPAISLLEFTRDREPQSGAAQRHFLLVADPSGVPGGPDGKALPALPGARREVSAVAKLLPASQVELLEGKEATELRVRERAGQSSVIHFATHGIIRDDRPFDSFLALSSTGPGKEQDGRFTAQEIYALPLQSELVFLSACRSGLGQVTGDGMMGLTRAFLSAGAPSVIASLWDVADEPTYRLIPAFYRQWLQGKTKAVALRSAQLDLLRALRAGQIKLHTPSGDIALPEDPVFWASFALQGEP